MSIEKKFLLAYAKKLHWKTTKRTSAEELMRKLCQEGYYEPSIGRKTSDKDFMMIAFGWIWGHTGDYSKANDIALYLMYKMGEIYKEINRDGNLDN